MAKTIFKTDKKENFQSVMKRIGFNFFPAYRRTGGRIVFISKDYKEVHVRLGLNWTTKNYVGTVFGGSIFGASDPIYMVQLYHILGKEDYMIWDTAGQVKFLKPIKKNVFAKFVLTDETIDEIKTKTSKEKKCTVNLKTVFEDEKQVVYAEIERTVFISYKKFKKVKDAVSEDR
jgi:acyl-coenzyme A thioesterase PaaI-like protein